MQEHTCLTLGEDSPSTGNLSESEKYWTCGLEISLQLFSVLVSVLGVHWEPSLRKQPLGRISMWGKKKKKALYFISTISLTRIKLICMYIYIHIRDCFPHTLFCRYLSPCSLLLTPGSYRS